MSLFGDDDGDSRVPAHMEQSQTKSIFGDSTGQNTQSNSLFQDENTTVGGGGGDSSSPWGLPTPKKAKRSDMVRNLLPASDVPESYVDTADSITAAGYRAGPGSISAEGVEKVLKSSGISGSAQTQVLRQVTAGASAPANLGRSEFFVLLALIGLAQEGEEATLDGVDERRRRLPTPKIGLLEEIKSSESSSKNDDKASDNGRPSTAGTARQAPPAPAADSPPRTTRRRQDSLNDDPWGSPDMHRGHAHATAETGSNGFSQSNTGSIHESTTRTTSGITTYTQDLPTTPSMSAPTAREEVGWGESAAAGGVGGAVGAAAGGPFGGGDGLTGGFADPVRPRPISRALGGGNRVSRAGGPEEFITVSLLPEKEGMFMFQHRNYEVKSTRRGSTVVRRYSDFVWLLDCLQKRYPFRQLPLLPPKRLQVNGRHLSNDPSFIEKRRRGLVRFGNALVRHPVLAQEQLVVMFLTVPTELAVWRKQATISVQEEFADRTLPPGLEESLSPTLDETLEKIRDGVRSSAEHYVNLCTLLERLSKRSQGLAADSVRVSQVLLSLTEDSNRTYAFEPEDVPGMNAGLQATARHLANHQQLLEDEAGAWDLGVLEDVKRQRDGLVSVRDLFDRRDRLARDNIPQLERRIESNEAKLSGLRLKPVEAVKPGEMEKVEQAILNDKQSIVAQHARGVLIRECVRDECVLFQASQYHVGRTQQDWSQERVKYAELVADNWRRLADEVERMPVGE